MLFLGYSECYLEFVRKATLEFVQKELINV